MPAEPASHFLTPTQRRLAAFALTFLSLLGIIALLIGALMLLGQLVGFFSSVIWPLAVAGGSTLVRIGGGLFNQPPNPDKIPPTCD